MIRAEGLKKVYRVGEVETWALRGVELEVAEGEFVAVEGPSGSGKTTLLNILGGLDKPTQGRVWVDGQEITGMSRGELAKFRLHNVGFVFQSYNLIEVLSALENAEFVLLLLGVPKAERRRRAMETLRAVGLEELAHRRPNQMSGGQQQRVAVARAVAAKPKLILADEPTANLDSTTSAQLMDLMRRLNQELGITFVFSSHDPLVIERARRVISLRDGRVVSDVRRD